MNCFIMIFALFAEDTTAREASRHFQRGVELYNDTDFRGALVEFKKAYNLLPRSNVLYDIGQTEYQLQDYAAALKTMERFLAETGPNAPHRAEVEEVVEVLRTRVGRIALTTDGAGCDVSLDDQPVGTAPLGRPLLVSVGTRKLAVSCAGRPVAQKRVEVTGGETVRVELRIPSAPGTSHAATALASSPEGDRKASHTNPITAWTLTGVLAAATIGIYTAALVESGQLAELRKQYPANRDALDSKSKLVTGLAIGGDVLAAATLAGICLSTYYTLTAPPEDKKLHVGLSWNGVFVSGTF